MGLPRSAPPAQPEDLSRLTPHPTPSFPTRPRCRTFDKLGEAAKEKAAWDIREDFADIIARAITEEHHRTELMDALANFSNDQTIAESEPSEVQEQHPVAAQILDVVEDILAELGKDMLMEALLPGAHVLVPPATFVDSVLTAARMYEIAGPAEWP